MTDTNLVIDNTEPRNVGAEQHVLGALLRKNDLYELVSDKLKPDHFFDPDHAEFYRLIVERLEAGQGAHPTVLRGQISENSEASHKFSKLCDGGISIIEREFRNNAAEVIEKGNYRNVIDACKETVREIVGAPWNTPISDFIGGLETKLDAIAEAGTSGNEPVSFNTAIDRLTASVDKAQRPENEERKILTGLVDLDNKLGRLTGGTLTVLAGGVGQGKTIFAMTVAGNNARRNQRGLFFSLEMSEEMLVSRQIAGLSGVSVRDQHNVMSDEQYNKYIMAAEELKALNLPLEIDYVPARKLSEIRRLARRAKRKGGLDFIIIDYLQIMGDDLSLRDAGQRTYQIAHNTVGLRNLAKELDIPIILLSQISRSVSQRDDKRPTMTDLSDASSIEKDADCILFIHREAYYLEQQKPVQGDREKDADFSDRQISHGLRLREAQGKAEIICVKARQAHAPFTVEVAYDGARAMLGNLAKWER